MQQSEAQRLACSTGYIVRTQACWKHFHTGTGRRDQGARQGCEDMGLSSPWRIGLTSALV